MFRAFSLGILSRSMRSHLDAMALLATVLRSPRRSSFFERRGVAERERERARDNITCDRRLIKLN